MATRKEKEGTVHELDTQISEIELSDAVRVKSNQANKYVKIFEEYKLFKKGISKQQKENIVKSISINRFDEQEIFNESQRLKSIASLNRLIEKKRRELESEVRSGKNVKKNMAILQEKEKYELDIPRRIRDDLNLKQREIKLRKYDNSVIKNRLRYYSGQKFDFILKTGFKRPYFVSYKELIEKIHQGKAIEWIINEFKDGVEKAFASERKKYEQKEPQKWKAKRKVFAKIFKFIEHNLQIATNKKYNKKLVHRDDEGNLEKNNSEYPIMMKITDEIIYLYIP